MSDFLIDEELLAAIDMGSNSFHLAIARVDHGEVKKVASMSEKVQLAAGLDENKNLTEAAQQRGLACLARFVGRLSSVQPTRLRIVATNALRQAKNGHVTDDNIAAIKNADIVVFAVKPQVLGGVLKPLKGLLEDKLLISIVAGAEIKTISDLTSSERVVRVMPNTPALVQTGAHGMFAKPEVSAKDRELATQVLAATGLTLWVSSEAQIDAVTAVSGSGPAYFFYMMESMIRAGKNMGLDEKVATALTLQTALGAAQMAITSSNAPSELRKNVTSPNGTTQAALEVFDRAQISQNIQTALAAAQKRSQELAQELSDSIK